MIATLLAAARLCGALVTLHGAEVPHHRLCRAAVIIAHVADEWPPELLAGIAWRESRFDASAVNPRTGCWGALQVSTRRRDRSEWAGYVAGVAKLRDADPAARAILVAAVAMGGCVGAMVCVGRMLS